MALSYTFDISTKVAPESLMRTFLLSLGLPWDPHKGCSATADTFDAGVGPLTGYSREITTEQLGFEPDTYFSFRTWADADIEAREQIVRGTLAICRAVTGDAALLFNGEYILFIRRAGTIYV